VDEATEQVLLDAIAQCDGGRTVPLDKVLSNLRTTIERAASARRQPARVRTDSGRERLVARQPPLFDDRWCAFAPRAHQRYRVEMNARAGLG
jgi:hypothetical protein